MRKRIVIGLVVVATAVIALVVFSGPKRGSVEYHKREYTAVRDRLLERTRSDAARRFCARVTGANIFKKKKGWRRLLWESFYRQERALIDLGFLERRTLSFHSFAGHYPRGMEILQRWEGMSLYARGDYGTGPKQIVVIGLPEDMPKWEELTRRIERESQERRQRAEQQGKELIQQMKRQKQGGTITN